MTLRPSPAVATRWAQIAAAHGFEEVPRADPSTELYRGRSGAYDILVRISPKLSGHENSRWFIQARLDLHTPVPSHFAVPRAPGRCRVAREASAGVVTWSYDYDYAQQSANSADLFLYVRRCIDTFDAMKANGRDTSRPADSSIEGRFDVALRTIVAEKQSDGWYIKRICMSEYHYLHAPSAPAPEPGVRWWVGNWDRNGDLREYGFHLLGTVLSIESELPRLEVQLDGVDDRLLSAFLRHTFATLPPRFETLPGYG